MVQSGRKDHTLVEKKKVNNREKIEQYFLCYSVSYAQGFTIVFNQLNRSVSFAVLLNQDSEWMNEDGLTVAGAY
jgi:hypothetical protein